MRVKFEGFLNVSCLFKKNPEDVKVLNVIMWKAEDVCVERSDQHVFLFLQANCHN